MSKMRDLIFNKDDRPTEKVNIPEWGVDVYIKTLSGAEREQYEKFVQDKLGTAVVKSGDEDEKTIDLKKVDIRHTRAFMVMLGTQDEEGQAIFTLEDLPKLNEKNGVVLERLANHIQEFNGMSKKSMEKIRKN